MQVLVDTNIWSLALRRSKPHSKQAEAKITGMLAELIRDNRVRLIGPIRQELLSGIRETTQFDRLKEYLRAFPDEPLRTDDFEDAAQCSNQCRSKGVTGSSIDFLICATSLSRRWQIFTTDTDFRAYAGILPISLFFAA